MSALITVLIADDLTGSLDAVAPFAALGLRSVAAVSPDAIAAALALGPQVVSVNLGTREAPNETARCRARDAALALVPATGPATVWIKKIDSRLKGPIAAELAGLTQVLHSRSVLICPAIPDLGRMVVQGAVQGHGMDQPLPVRSVLPPDLSCLVPDAQSDADLDQIAAGLDPGGLAVAARGLSAALARRLRPGVRPVPAVVPCGPMGFVIGSRDPVTLAQVAHLQQGGGPPHLTAPDGWVPEAAGAEGGFVLLATAGRGASGAEVAARLAQGAVPRLGGLGSVLLSGGETAAAVLQASGIEVLRIAGEVLPGLPLAHAPGRPDLPALITKSGGFGQPDTLLRLWQAAQAREGEG